MIIVIVGASASGKTTLANYIESQSTYKRLVTYTSRPIRPGEKDGIDYYFVPESFFTEHQDKFLEVAQYNGWWYGSLKSDFQAASNTKINNIIAILTPSGMRELARLYAGSMVTIYLDVPRRDRMIQLLNRGDNIDESYRRNLSDVGQFDGVEKEVDIWLKNDGYQFTPKQLFDSAMRYSWETWGVSLL